MRPEVSFHLPLHRAYGVFLSLYHSQRSNSDTIDSILGEIMPSDAVAIFLRHLQEAPLRIQSTLAEMGAGMWKKNGPIADQAESIYRCVYYAHRDIDWFSISELFFKKFPAFFMSRFTYQIISLSVT